MKFEVIFINFIKSVIQIITNHCLTNNPFWNPASRINNPITNIHIESYSPSAHDLSRGPAAVRLSSWLLVSTVVTFEQMLLTPACCFILDGLFSNKAQYSLTWQVKNCKTTLLFLLTVNKQQWPLHSIIVCSQSLLYDSENINTKLPRYTKTD